MVREPFPELNGHPDEPAPTMFTRPSDAPDPLPPIHSDEQVSTLHRQWLRITTTTAGQDASTWHRFRRRVRRIADRGSGSLDREMIGDLIRAVDAVAARCDEISERLAQQQIVLDDAVTILGEELTRLRAESAPLVGPARQPSPLTPMHDA
jgi:hypothetical protein